MGNIPYIPTPEALNVVLKGRPYSISKEQEHYARVLEMVKGDATEDEVLGVLEEVKHKLEAAVEAMANPNRGVNAEAEGTKVEIKGGIVYYDGKQVSGFLADRMVDMVKEGFSLVPWARFLDNLSTHPGWKYKQFVDDFRAKGADREADSMLQAERVRNAIRVVEDLYRFLEKGGIPLTPDGYFMAYKAVRDDYMDIHSGTFDNAVGKVPEMPREMVDDDPHRTCSRGLHVCSFDYLSFFSHANGHVMQCKVHPADVVAIPADYNDAKMRVCRYTVVAEHEGFYQERPDLAWHASVFDQDQDSVFAVMVDYGDGFEHNSGHDSLSDAAVEAEDLLEDSDVRAVRIINTTSDVEIWSKENTGYIPDDGDHLVEHEEDDNYKLFGIRVEDGVAVELGEYDDKGEAIREMAEYSDWYKLYLVTDDGELVTEMVNK
jgi:hypothetical protein